MIASSDHTNARPTRFLTLACCIALALPGSLAAQPPADLALELVVGGLASPVAVRHAGDGSGRLFIVEQEGRIQIWDGSPPLQEFLDITDRVVNGGERGLLGLAFHPDYANNGFFYVNYTADPSPGRTVVSRFSVTANPDVADPNSELILLEIIQDFSNHNGGDIHFGPDGYLYIGMGDGGGAGDPNNRAQDLGELLGKMLRIDVDGGPGVPAECGLVGNYTVPASNPFVGVPGCDEIWSLGLRNPFRWSFDRLMGDLFIGDVGQGAWEEIDFQPAASGGGENWGWDCREGAHPCPHGSCSAVCTGPGPLIDPILEYSHAGGTACSGSANFVCAVIGGFRYQGNVIGGFSGTYVYGDNCSGEICFATQSGVSWSASEWMDTSLSISSFGEDEDGELYVVNLGGVVWRLVSPSSIFTDGFESGDTSAWSGTSSLDGDPQHAWPD